MHGRGDGGTPLRLAYRDWGGQGDPLILLHGLSSNSRIWDLTAPLLTTRFRVVALDQRGHGISDQPASYTAADWTGDVTGVMDALEWTHSTIVGHSWGANVALQFAADHPDRITAIALVDGGISGLASRMSWEEAEKVMRPPEINGVPLDKFVAFARQWPDIGPLWSDEVREMLLSNLQVRDGKVYRKLTIENHMKILRAMYEQDIPGIQSAVECPALLIIANQDRDNDLSRRWTKWRREGAKEAEKKLKDGTVLWMDDTIHDVPVQRPRELADAILTLA